MRDEEYHQNITAELELVVKITPITGLILV